MPKTDACEVCGAPASCVGSAKYICRSCSTFYRRVYSKYGTLKCRRNGTCEIREAERTICRSCRLQKCRDVGLRMAGKNLIIQYNGYPENDLDVCDKNVFEQMCETVDLEKQKAEKGAAEVTSTSSFPDSSLNDYAPNSDLINYIPKTQSNPIPSSINYSSKSQPEDYRQRVRSDDYLLELSSTIRASRTQSDMYASNTSLNQPVKPQQAQSKNVYNPNTYQFSSTIDAFQPNDEAYTTEYCLNRAQQLLNEFPNGRYPMLSKVVDAFMQFERRQRFMLEMHLGKDVEEGEMTKLTHKIGARMDGSTYRIACMFVMEILNGCDLTQEQRVSVLKKASIQVAMAHKFTLNAPRFFPKFGDTRVSSYVGLYYDTKDLSYIFSGLPPSEHKIDLIRPICETEQQTTDKARLLRPNIIEAIFLMAVILFEEVERQLILNTSVRNRREHLYADFTAYQINAHGGDVIAAGTRLIKLTSYVYENKAMTVVQEELYNMAEIFLPGFRESYYEYLKTGQFQYNSIPLFPSEDFVQRIAGVNLDV